MFFYPNTQRSHGSDEAQFLARQEDGLLRRVRQTMMVALSLGKRVSGDSGRSDGSVMVNMTKQPFYVADTFGLKAVHESGRLNLTIVPGASHSVDERRLIRSMCCHTAPKE